MDHGVISSWPHMMVCENSIFVILARLMLSIRDEPDLFCVAHCSYFSSAAVLNA